MPQTIPPFSQFQGPLVPLRGLWNSSPQEGDRFVNCEIDWIDASGGNSALQFSLSGNSPVALSQIVALSVDNRRCGFDVDFMFPDSGFVLTVPAYNQGVYPVFTNALMFYAVALGVTSGNKTVLQVLNSMPPPVAIQPTVLQQQDNAIGVALGQDGTTTIVAPPTSGTITGISVVLNFGGNGVATLMLQDGSGAVIWSDAIAGVAGGNQIINIPNLRVRFTGGLFAQVIGSTFAPTGGAANINVFFSTP